MRSPSPTRYANSGGVHIAYQVVGEGPLDLIFVPGWVSHVEHHWEEPRLAYFLHRLAGFSRLIILDKRGTGLSDRVTPLPDLEQRMDDVRAVQDAVGSERAVLFGYSEGGSMCQLFAATYPARTLALITYGCWAKRLRAPDYPWGPTLEERQRFYDFVVTNWGGVVDLADLAPSVANDPEFCEWFASYLRRSASPGAALALAQMNTHIDLRPVLPSILVPTLVIHRTEDRDAPIGGARYLAEHIPGARLLELPGADHLPWVSDTDSVLDAIEHFLESLNLLHAPSRSLAAVLALRWQPNAVAGDRRELERIVATHGGDTLDPARSAAMRASFSGAVRAIRCALELRSHADNHGCAVRIGVHLGECRHNGESWQGPALDLASRIGILAEPGEIVVSRQVKDLMTGSGIPFVDLPERRAHGIEGFELFLVEPQASDYASARATAPTSASRLTRPQRTILELVAQGMSNKEIARLMRRSEHTIHRHMANIFDRLGVSTRAAAVAKGAMGTVQKMARTGDDPHRLMK
jgi:pimeloyl-ACP methyl ester carboxylesterase/DNA-binding CsgD family transcriptional regulator